MILERMQAAEGAEIWWDSLPTSYLAWKERLVASVPFERRAGLEADMRRFWDPNTGEGLVRGCTSNPRLVLEALQLEPERWAETAYRLAREHATSRPEEVHWLLYREVFRQNARALLPLWERSEGRHGWVCAQLPPTSTFEVEAMVAAGEALAALGPNVMVKVVGSEQGYQAIERLTGLGIATNSTLSFSVSQVERGLVALSRGLATARRRGVDLSTWRAVATFMMGRVGAETELYQQAAHRDLPFTQEAVRWAEVAIARRLHGLIAGQEERIKLLLCSLKTDPWHEPTACFHLEKCRGLDCVYTVSPPFLTELLAPSDSPALSGPGCREAVPATVFEVLERLPYFREAYESGAIAPEAFCLQPAFLRGLQEVNSAHRETLDWLRLTLARKETTLA